MEEEFCQKKDDIIGNHKGSFLCQGDNGGSLPTILMWRNFPSLCRPTGVRNISGLQKRTSGILETILISLGTTAREQSYTHTYYKKKNSLLQTQKNIRLI